MRRNHESLKRRRRRACEPPREKFLPFPYPFRQYSARYKFWPSPHDPWFKLRHHLEKDSSFVDMSQYSHFGPVLVGSCPVQQPLPHAVASAQAVQPGHPVCSAQYATQSPHHTAPYVVPTTSSPPNASPHIVYSRTPSPSTPAVLPSPQHASHFSHPPCPEPLLRQALSLYALWPMSGPPVPPSLIAYMTGSGPAVNLNELQTNLYQVKADIASGMYNLHNPGIADPRTVVSSWSDGVDVLQTPWVIADPRIHGAPLPPPEALPAISTMVSNDLQHGF